MKLPVAKNPQFGRMNRSVFFLFRCRVLRPQIQQNVKIITDMATEGRRPFFFFLLGGAN